MGGNDPILRNGFPSPVAAQGRVAMDVVFIEGLTGETVIGIDESELHEPQPVRLDLAIGVSSILACRTDRIEDTVNYAAVRESVLVLFASHRVQLLEALAELVAQLVIADFGAQWVRVSLAKPGKFADVASVGVVIERSRRLGDFGFSVLGRGFVPEG